MNDSHEEKISFNDVLLVPQYSEIRSRSEITTQVRLGRLTLDIPIIASNMDTITGIKMIRKMDELGGLGIMHRGNPPDSKDFSIESMEADLEELIKEWSLAPRKYLALSVGSIYVDRECARIGAILRNIDNFSIDHESTAICVDFAHGDSAASVDTIAYIREKGYRGTIIGGAVCTPDACRRLMTAGANAVRVGIGPGGFCSTRIKTGCGYPQLSAIKECAETGVPIIADGGIRHPGDAAKALAAGARAVMLGSWFAATDCVPGWDRAISLTDSEYDVSAPFIVCRGMASNSAKTAIGAPEGFEEGISIGLAPKTKGSTEEAVKNMMDGVISAMSYQNSKNLSEFRTKAKFVRVSASVMQENRPHIKE